MPHQPTRSAVWLGFLLLIGMELSPIVRADETLYNLQAVDEVILPGYERLAEQTEKLSRRTADFCQRPDEPGLQALREHYHLAMDSWQFIQPVRLGPIEQSLRGYRLQFWPDKRQSVSRHLATLLDKADPENLEPERFAKGSVAVQGFSALERLLFAADLRAAEFSPSGAMAYHCRVMLTITRNLAGIAQALVREWRTQNPTHRDLIAGAAQGNQAYADGAEVSARLFNGLFTQIELILDRKLRAPLGESLQQARGKRSESWRSGRSLRNMEQNLESIRQLTKTAFLRRLLDAPLKRRIEEHFATCLQALSAIQPPLAQAVTDPLQRQGVEAQVASLAELRQILIGELAPALEIPIGFNSLDGD